ncbi:MAG: UpxY family transcription antiterminator [Planctomycetia bacterium]|nr:UpxY family transcription antiterminator [Planctomycetia bacterium]
MPRLQLEPYLSKDSLFTDISEKVDSSRGWWVLYTKPRAEKSLARKLNQQGKDFFLPIHEFRTLRKNRVLKSYLPLFPGYVFIHGSDEDRVQSLKTNMIIACIPVIDQVSLHHDLHAVHRLIQSGEVMTPEKQLMPGQTVEILHGSLQGMTGKIIRKNNKEMFVVEVRMLQRGVSVQIESWMIGAVTPNVRLG